MTDRRYTGPDGAKRLRMLEGLAAHVPGLYHFFTESGMMPILCRMSEGISQDNERVDRLEQEREKGRTEPRWGWFKPDPLD